MKMQKKTEHLKKIIRVCVLIKVLIILFIDSDMALYLIENCKQSNNKIRKFCRIDGFCLNKKKFIMIPVYKTNY